MSRAALLEVIGIEDIVDQILDYLVEHVVVRRDTRKEPIWQTYTHIDGIKQGELKEYRHEGTIQRCTLFHDGLIVGEIKYNCIGQRIFQSFIDGRYQHKINNHVEIIGNKITEEYFHYKCGRLIKHCTKEKIIRYHANGVISMIDCDEYIEKFSQKGKLIYRVNRIG
jgi:hypothetical protein